MTVVWSWADLGNHDLQKFNIKQYWLLMSVLSVKKFNPDWKRVFFIDNETYKFLKEKNWTQLWDEVNVVDFHNTEYGDLYDIYIYAWPKIYSYGLVDDDILIVDIDTVFIKEFVIDDFYKISGNAYNHFDDFLIKTKTCNLQYKWETIDFVQNELYKNGVIDNLMNQFSSCFLGSPIYCPKEYCKDLQRYLITHIQKVEKYFNGICPCDTYQSIEEEFPLYTFAENTTGTGVIDNTQYRHGYTYLANFNIDSGFEKAEKILEIPVFEIYLKNNE